MEVDDTEPIILSDELIATLLAGVAPENIQAMIDYTPVSATRPPPKPPHRRAAQPAPAKPRPPSALSKLPAATGEWVPVSVTMRDPAFMSRIKLAGVGNQCAHWQPFCLIAHWRRSCNSGGPARSGRSGQPYPCPVAGCNRSINFDAVVLFDDLSQGHGRPHPLPDDALLVRRPVMVSASMKPVAPDAAKRGLVDRSLIGAAADDKEEQEEGIVEPVEDPHTLKRRVMLQKALEHPPDHWRERYCAERDALKKLRRRALRANEQLNIMLADNAELRATLKERVAAVEMLRNAATPAPPAVAIPVPRQVLNDARFVAYKKKTQLEYAITRELSAKKPIGGAQASYDRRLLFALWRTFVDYTEMHFACADEEEEEVPKKKRKKQAKPKKEKKKARN